MRVIVFIWEWWTGRIYGGVGRLPVGNGRAVYTRESHNLRYERAMLAAFRQR